jgi:hypothetical protein
MPLGVLSGAVSLFFPNAMSPAFLAKSLSSIPCVERPVSSGNAKLVLASVLASLNEKPPFEGSVAPALAAVLQAMFCSIRYGTT